MKNKVIRNKFEINDPVLIGHDENPNVGTIISMTFDPVNGYFIYSVKWFCDGIVHNGNFLEKDLTFCG